MKFIILTQFSRTEEFIVNIEHIQTIWEQDNGSCLITLISGNHTDDIHVKESLTRIKQILGC